MLNVPKKYFFGLSLFAVFLIWWWNNFGLPGRHPTAVRDVNVIGSRGEVVLFYRNGQNVQIKQCEDATLFNTRDDCQLKSGTVEQTIGVSGFREALKKALMVEGGRYGDGIKGKIDIYNKHGEQGDPNKLLENQKLLKQQVARLERFVGDLGGGNNLRERLARYKDELAQVEKDLDDYATSNRVVKEIDEEIEKIVDDTLTSDQWKRLTFSNEGTGFAFNLLMAYLGTPALSMAFVKIDAGEFLMGSDPDSDDLREDDENGKDKKPVHVSITRAFEIMKTEVTQLQWFQVMGENPSEFKGLEYCKDDYLEINGKGLCPNHPVEKVSWNEIVYKFIQRLNHFHGLTECRGHPEDKKGCYRLPTEAEWEFAARGGTETRYSFGDDPDPAILNKYAWYQGNAHEVTRAVALKEKNPYGLYDVHGNVWEWVQDKFTKFLPGGENPLHEESGNDRVFRGGSCSRLEQFLRSSQRNRGGPDHTRSSIGFRVVRNL